MSLRTQHQLLAIARRQAGVFTRSQAVAAGITDKAILGQLRSGAWARVHPGVYLVVGAALGPTTTLWAALLAAGGDAVVSHQAAARLLGLPGPWASAPVLTVTHPRHPRVAGAFVHQISDVAPHHVERDAQGLPVTTVVRTIVDLAAVVGAAVLRVVVGEALAERRVDLAATAVCLGEVARPGKPGVRKLGRVLDGLAGEPPPASKLERRLSEILARGRLPPLRLQYPFPGRQFTTGCVDGAYPDCKLIVEADGRRWHSREQDMKRDRDRDAEAARHGWQTLRFLWEHVAGDPEGVGATIRDTRQVRLSQLVA